MTDENQAPGAVAVPPHFEDIPVACTDSGAVYLFLAVVEGDQHRVAEIRRRLLSGDQFFYGVPCASCRTITSKDHRTEKNTTCEYRLLRGPLFVPRASGASPPRQAPYPSLAPPEVPQGSRGPSGGPGTPVPGAGKAPPGPFFPWGP